MLLVNEIEKKYLKKLNQIDYWPYLRLIVGSISIKRNRGTKETKEKKTKYFNIKYLFEIFIQIRYLFKKYEYVVFGLTDNLKKDGNKYIDRFTHDLFKNSPKNDTLYIQHENHLDQKKVEYPKVSYFLFRILSIFIFKKYRPNIILEELENKYKLGIDFKKEQTHFFKLYKIFKIYFEITKPKKIFITCYTFKHVIKAANDLGIEVVEFQHGLIEKNYAYDYRFIEKNGFNPSKIIVFGNFDRNIILKYKYTEYITIGGNFYASKIKKNCSITLISRRKKLKKSYKYIVCVSLQDPIVQILTDLVIDVAKLYSQFFFIFVPRNKFPNKKIHLENIVVENDNNLYDYFQISDIHLCGYSSSCVEAAYFGLPNLFFNINGLSDFYFKKYINDEDFNILINNNDELNYFLKYFNGKKFNKKNIQKSNQKYMIDYDYKSLNL